MAFSPDGKTIAAGYDSHGGDGGGVVLWDVAARKRLVDEPLSVKEGDGFERGLQPRRQDHRGRIRRLPAAAAAWCCGTWPHANAWSTSHFAVKEGDVASVAFSPDGKTIAAGYGSVDGVGGGVVLWDVAARKRLVDEPLAVKEGDVVERGLQPRRQDHRGRIRVASAAAWCCGTWPHANDWSTSHSP